MPFDLWVSRNRRFDTAQTRQPIEPDAFENLAERGPGARRRPDGAWWLVRPDTAEPWLSARLDHGQIVLSCSYTNHRYLANFIDAFTLALRFASAFNAQVFEEVSGEVVTATSVERFQDGRGDYARTQYRVFRGVLDQMDSTPGGPLEWPLGPIDLVSEYCVFYVQPGDEPLPPPAAALDGLPIEGEFRSAHPSAGTVVDLVNLKPVPFFKVLLRPDGQLQLWPAHGRTSFAEAATRAFETARVFRQRYGGSLLFNGQPVSTALEAELATRVTGLGVEFYEWHTTRRGQSS